PREPRQRLGDFLEPAIVSVPPVADVGVGAEGDLHPAGGGLRRRRTHEAERQRIIDGYVAHGRCRARDDTIVEALLPPCVKVRRFGDVSPILAQLLALYICPAA